MQLKTDFVLQGHICSVIQITGVENKTETVLGRWEMLHVCKRSNNSIFSRDRGPNMISGDQDPLQQNFTETLPTEMSVRIFSELDVRSLCRASLTCRLWNDIIECSDQLWRGQCLTALAICRREVDGDRLAGCSWKVWVIAVKILHHFRPVSAGCFLFPFPFLFQVTLVRNYRKGCVKRRWLKGRYSNIRSADDIPPNSMCPLDVETWGEILEAELDR